MVWGPDFFGPYDKPPEPYGKTPDTGGAVKFGDHEPWNVLCPCENCVIPRLAFQRWRYQRGLLTENLSNQDMPEDPQRDGVGRGR